MIFILSGRSRLDYHFNDKPLRVCPLPWQAGRAPLPRDACRPFHRTAALPNFRFTVSLARTGSAPSLSPLPFRLPLAEQAFCQITSGTLTPGLAHQGALTLTALSRLSNLPIFCKLCQVPAGKNRKKSTTVISLEITGTQIKLIFLGKMSQELIYTLYLP